MGRNISYALAFYLVCGFLLISCGGRETGSGSQPGSTQEKIVIKIASVLPAEHPSSQALEFFKTRLAELSGGTIEGQLFLNSQLGSAEESIQNCQGGNIQITFASVAPTARHVKEFNALAMPFIFRDKPHEFAVVDGKIGKRLSQKLEPSGLRNLCYFDAGSRNIMTKKGPIQKPEDLKGMKIRVMESKLMVDSINALGASAISMTQGEVYSALQTGVLDGWENNPPTTLSFKMYETGCVYYAWTRHLSVPDLLLINLKFYDNLPEDMRGCIDQAARETVVKQRELWKESEQKAVEELKSKGMLFNEVNASEFAAKVGPVYDECYQSYGKEFEEICKAIRDLK
ncbi:TRAP transporter substrate-binding protein [Candidatus Sumerlaeota bacterium]|nr:TRAP transporter substrate-binding protein [Candidatus Sumerlaeota bacterium]